MLSAVESSTLRFAFRDPALASSSRRPPLARDELNIALCVPLSGTTGIWGPSSLASAELAVSELNREAGVGGRVCRLLKINASDEAIQIEGTLTELVQAGDIDAIIGMHTSGVRQRVLRAVGGQIPIVYTPLYEGGESTAGVFAIGETAASQLQPAINFLGERKRLRRWFAVGNDYVWPHASHRLARKYIADAGATLVGENYIPFGTTDFSSVLDAVRQSRADAVLVSLIGQDSIEFNRAFGRSGLHRDMLRLSCALGENELLGIGSDNTEDLYVASGYFATLDTEANVAFKERYYAQFGQRAPTLNTFGQSTYEGMHFLAALVGGRLRSSTGSGKLGGAPLHYRSAREARYVGGGITCMPIYLASAEDNQFRVVARLQSV